MNLMTRAAVIAPCARAQHEAGESTNAHQNLVSHDNVTVTAAAHAVQVLPASNARVTAICVNVGANDVTLGHADASDTRGVKVIPAWTAKLDKRHRSSPTHS